MKINKKKIFAFSGVFAIVLVIGLYIIFSDTTLCKAVKIEFVQDSITYIIDETDVKNIVLKEYKNILGSPINTIDLLLLENLIEDHPSIKNAEVYKKIDGVLSVKVENRIPIVRIVPEKGPHFYIDKEGEFMPLSNMGSARVVVANGNFKYIYNNSKINILDDTLVTKTLADIWLLSKYISDDSFLTAQIEQIYITPEGEYELIPKVGKHIVLLGDTYNYENKLKYLKHLYLNVLKEEGWRTYNYFNLKYKGQIVCTKNET